jgi:hypothetical protein
MLMSSLCGHALARGDAGTASWGNHRRSSTGGWDSPHAKLGPREHTGSVGGLMETGDFSPTLFLSFLPVRTSFLEEKTFYCFSALSPQ